VRAGVLVAIALVVAACSTDPDDGYAVDLTIVPAAELSTAALASIRSLEFSASGSESAMHTESVTNVFANRKAERVIYRPHISGGLITITLTARNENNDAVGFGTTDVMLRSGSTQTATMALGTSVPVVPPDMTSSPAINVTPPSATVTTGKTLQLAANEAVGWSVLESGGGIVSSSGLYTAPGIAGIFHVVATATNDSTRTGSATLTVARPNLDVVAGAAPSGFGAAGFSDGIGTAARFGSPFGLASDGTYVYISDTSNGTLRRYVRSTGAVTTIAGTPGLVDVKDGIGAGAHFGGPTGLALDGAGNLYVCDAQSVVRKVVLSSGTVTTVAGAAFQNGGTNGVGAAARFNWAFGVTFDNGNLYVADGVQIRKVVLSSGTVSTFAGNIEGPITDGIGAAAGFTFLTSITGDGAGTLYGADYLKLRKIVVSSAAVTTLTGDTTATGGLTMTSDHSTLLMTDNQTLRQLDLGTGTYTVLSGQAGISASIDGTNGRFKAPYGIAVGTGDEVFVADISGALRRYSSGVLSTVAGVSAPSGTSDGLGTAARLGGLNGAVVDPLGNTYLTDSSNCAIRKIAPDTTVTTSTAAGCIFDGVGSAVGITTDQMGTLYVANAFDRIVTVVPPTITVLAGTGNPGADDGNTAGATFNAPSGITYDSGKVYVADSGNHTIREIDPVSMTVTTLAGSAGVRGMADGVGAAARFNLPLALVADHKGNLFVSDSLNHTVRKIVIATATVSTIAGMAGVTGAADGIAVNARFYRPSGIEIDSGGSVYVADTYNSTLRKISPTGDVSTIVGVAGQATVKLGTLPAGLSAPAGLAFSPDGSLFITDTNEAVLLKARLP